MSGLMFRVLVLCSILLYLVLPDLLKAQELPYFVTYSHHMEEPGSLEVETKTASGHPRKGNVYYGTSVELEYGTRAWWTSELYVDAQSTLDQSTLFTGFRLENRFRPLLREYVINPVIYAEFEDINGADKSLLEIVGHDGRSNLIENNRTARLEKKREVELKLILSSNARGWNFSENLIGEKNLAHAPWEFGYALAASRPLRLRASVGECRLCAENVQVGAEMYGGLGDVDSLGLHNTSHYFAPTVNWTVPYGPTFSFSPGFGLNDYGLKHVFRFGVSYELGQVARLLRTPQRIVR